MTRPQPYVSPKPVRGRIARRQPLGLPLVNMGFNELPYPPTSKVAEALARQSATLGSYGPPTCDPLRAKLAETWGLNAERIICGNGSEELLDVVARCFVRPGDEVLISEFGYIQFELTANRLGAKLVKAAEQDHRTDVDALIAAAGPETRLVFLANPNNPTGTLIPVEELARLIDGLPDAAVIVLDLADGEFAGEEYCAAVHALAAQHDNVTVTRTFSKAFGLAGARVGWADAPEWMMPALYAVRGMGSVNALAQACAVAALEDMTVIRGRVAEILSERARVAAALAEMGMKPLPSATNFLLISAGNPDRTEALVEHLFDTCGIIVSRTREAGLEDYMRFSLSLPAHNDLLLGGVRRFLSDA
ncbi:MAG: histidinol-phosphate transaminase [Paracoccaceae bacterium]